MIKHVVITHILHSNLLSIYHFNFVSGRSVQLKLLSLLDRWTYTLDSGHIFDVIYLDFKKILDSVFHKHLLCKLHAYGFCDPQLTWLMSFVIGRHQNVCVHDTAFS